MVYPGGEFTGPPLPTITKLTVWVSDDVQPTMSGGQLLTISAVCGAVSVGDDTRHLGTEVHGRPVRALPDRPPESISSKLAREVH